MSFLKWSMGVCAVALVFAFSATLQAEIVEYREIFPNATADTRVLSDEGWSAHGGSGAAFIPASSTAPVDGRPIDAQPINSSPGSTEIAKGYAWLDSVDPAIVWTDEVSALSIVTSDVLSVSWYQGNMSASTAVRPAVKVGSSWFTTVASFTNSPITSGNDFDTDAELKSVAFSTAQWYSLSFTPDYELLLDTSGTVSLPSGTLTAAGLYSDGGSTDSQRFDTFEIMVPEPSPAVLWASLAVALLLWRCFCGGGARLERST